MATTATQDSKFLTPVLPDFTRWSWASVEERQWWNPLFDKAKRAFIAVERISVMDGTRIACWQPVPVQELVDTVAWAQAHGLLCVPTNLVAHGNAYTNNALPGTGAYRCLFVKPEHYASLLPFDDDKMGRLLGYPTCCRRAFADTWGRGQVDSTYEQWGMTQSVKLHMCHTMLRSLGIRLVSHMPCAFDCQTSFDIAGDFARIGIKAGYREEMVLLKEVLQWPVQWSRLFGIAEITTPAVKISTRSDWTPAKEEFSFDGTYHKPEPWLWKDNGFGDPDAMRGAHDILINSLKEELPQGARLVDLGCGNGLLLRRLTIHRPDVRIAGIDTNAAAIAHAGMTGKWWSGRIEDGVWVAWKPTAVLMSIERYLEMSPAERVGFHEVTKETKVFIYAYGDTLKRDTLEALTYKHFPIRMLQKTPDVSVGIA